MTNNIEKTTRQVRRNPNPTGKGGFGDNPQNINAGGEPKNSMKNYVAKKLALLSDEEKDKWLKDRKISGIDEWKMAEGNPSSEYTGRDGAALFSDEQKAASKKAISSFLDGDTTGGE